MNYQNHPMKISYRNKKDEKLCNNTKAAIKKMGKEVAYKLADLLNLIESFPNLKSLWGMPQYRLHALKGNRQHQYSLVISKSSGWRLIVYPLDEDGNFLKAGNKEMEMLAKAVNVEIVEVSDHYEE